MARRRFGSVRGVYRDTGDISFKRRTGRKINEHRMILDSIVTVATYRSLECFLWGERSAKYDRLLAIFSRPFIDTL